MKFLNYKKNSLEEISKKLSRPIIKNDQVMELKIKDMIKNIKNKGDTALKNYTKKFDKVSIDNFLVNSEELKDSLNKVDKNKMNLIKKAAKNIELFHKAQINQNKNNILVKIHKGIVCKKEKRPIEKVGLYIPGGNAPLVSTVLMLIIPAYLAKCKEIILCSPPQKDGKIDPYILASANLYNINKIYKIGGAQAIIAMAYGTKSIPKVDKIFGPGNSRVTKAKSLISNDPLGASIDMPAGPSEVLVIADKSANISYIAADLLSQAEHGFDSQVVLISPDEEILNKTKKEVLKQLKNLKRKDFAASSLKNSFFILTKNIEEAIILSNIYAPEHLILNFPGANKYTKKIINAGSVFIGKWTPESVGDYASGTNHVLPTYGFARSYSGLSVDSFQKSITFQELTKEGLQNIAPIVETIADIEGLDAHKNAITVRLK